MSAPAAIATRHIPFTRPHLTDAEYEAALQVLRSGQIGGNGSVGADLERAIQSSFGVRRALLTTSCTHALEMAAMALEWGPGDEVILPSFAFVTAATAIVRQGARPVFAEIDETTWNIDPADVRQRITPRTRAILPIHYAGQGCDMHALLDVARQHNLHIVEDAAQGVGARFDGRWLGTIGHIGCYSFHVTKNVSCGEGGAFLTDDPAIAERAEILREKGTNRSKFLRGEVDKYTWVGMGSSYVLSDLLAAVARVQFERWQEMQRHREAIWRRYQGDLAALAATGAIILPGIHPLAEPNWHIYAFRTAEPARRDPLLAHLKARGIQASFHFVPLHSSPYARQHLGCAHVELPITDRVSESLVRLPIYPDLSPADQAYIVDAVYAFFAH